MKKIIGAPAKINLTLEVVGKRKDGYHLLRTVMLKLNKLQDKLAHHYNMYLQCLDHPVHVKQYQL